MTSTTPYKPRAGSAAEAALRHLQGRGWTTATDLSDGIDVDHGSLHGSMNLAVEHGLVLRELRDGVSSYCLPDEAPAESPAPQPVPQTLPIGLRTLERMPFGGKPILRVRAAERQDAGDEPVTMEDARAAFREVENRLRPEIPAPHFEVGAFTDGRLMLEIGDERYTLSEAEKLKLFDFLIKMETGR